MTPKVTVVTKMTPFFSTEPTDESFGCKNCGKMYSNPASLIGHLKYKCNTGIANNFIFCMLSLYKEPN